MPLNVKDFGARGDGGTDDTAAIQLALDALMAIPRGGTLYFPAGIYIVKYTLQLVGNPGHNYTIIGDGGGLTSITTLKWAGPPKCTMLDCWGLNWTQFKGLIFDGGGTNLSIAGPSDPPVGKPWGWLCHLVSYQSIQYSFASRHRSRRSHLQCLF